MARTRRAFLITSAQVAAGGLAGAAAGAAPPALAADGPAPALDFRLPEPPLADADYWAFADWVQPYFDAVWDQRRRSYQDGGGVGATMNAALLTTHAIAALAGHQGATRQDARARLIARRLCESPPWRPAPRAGAASAQPHRPGWYPGLDRGGKQHTSVDPKVAEGLTYAWRARRELDLPGETVRMIVNRVNACARGRFFRYPAVRLNQMNWPCELYAHAATVTGGHTLLRHDYRHQVTRFARGIKRPPQRHGAPNLSPSYSYHYQPGSKPFSPHNLDTAEYANIVADALSFYDQARAAGMAPIAERHRQLLVAWFQRLLCGYWTHAGYLNWDTGLSLRRWHLGRYWAFSLQGILAVATAHRFRSEAEGRWAKYVFDRSLGLYQRLSRDRGGSWRVPRSSLYGVTNHGAGFPRILASRFQAAAAQAAILGLGTAAAEAPPPLYSFDPAIGRLTVTTPVYNTAILAVTNGAVPYGGTELARLYDSTQRVVANIGGRPPASFGVVVRDAQGHLVIASQHGHRRPNRRHPRLVLTRSPRGPVRGGAAYPRRPYAGPFTTLEAVGRTQRHGVAVRTTHGFTADRIEQHWSITRHGRQRRLSADVLFPTWGRGARVDAVLAGGGRVPLAGPGTPDTEIALERVDYFHLVGDEAGYVVVPTVAAAGAVARIARPRRQPSAPNPGPTLVVRLAERTAWRRLRYGVRIAPATTAAEAEVAASELGAS